MQVPSAHQDLFIATQSKTGAAASPFIVATKLVSCAFLASATIQPLNDID